MYNVVSGARGRERDLEEARGGKRTQRNQRTKRSRKSRRGREGSDRADGSEYSGFSELADTACRVPTMLLFPLTCRFQLSVQRSTLNAQR